MYLRKLWSAVVPRKRTTKGAFVNRISVDVAMQAATRASSPPKTGAPLPARSAGSMAERTTAKRTDAAASDAMGAARFARR